MEEINGYIWCDNMIGERIISTDASLPYHLFAIWDEKKNRLLHVGILPKYITSQSKAEAYSVRYALIRYRKSSRFLTIFNDNKKVANGFKISWNNVRIKFRNPNNADDYIHRIILEHHGVKYKLRNKSATIDKIMPIYKINIRMF